MGNSGAGADYRYDSRYQSAECPVQACCKCPIRIGCMDCQSRRPGKKAQGVYRWNYNCSETRLADRKRKAENPGFLKSNGFRTHGYRCSWANGYYTTGFHPGDPADPCQEKRTTHGRYGFLNL